MSKVTCFNCGAVEDIDVAVEGGEWIPSFWDEATDEEVGPVCPACVASLGILYDKGDLGFYRPVAVAP